MTLRMTSDLALGLTQQMLWTAMLVAGPVIGVSMVVGLLVSIFQVVTQIQEMTLTFIPKLLAIFLVLVLLGPWMLSVLVQFGVTVVSNIPNYVG
jgi:flagellar biosynthesis protein FliQ